jgi:hypothetical protein
MAGAEIRIPADEQLNPPLLSDFHIPDGARMLRLLPLRGEEGGGLVEDSSLQCPRWRKVVRRRAVTQQLEGIASAWQWRATV